MNGLLASFSDNLHFFLEKNIYPLKLQTIFHLGYKICTESKKTFKLKYILFIIDKQKSKKKNKLNIKS